MEAVQRASGQPTNHRRNQKRNQNLHRKKLKLKHNNPKPMDTVKAVLRGRFIAVQAYIKKQEKKVE